MYVPNRANAGGPTSADCSFAPHNLVQPSLNEMSGPEAANATVAVAYDAMIRGAMDDATLANYGVAWMDVRDIAEAHVRALQRAEVAGRIILSKECFKVQDWRACLRTPLFLAYELTSRDPRSECGARAPAAPVHAQADRAGKHGVRRIAGRARLQLQYGRDGVGVVDASRVSNHDGAVRARHVGGLPEAGVVKQAPTDSSPARH